MTINRKSPFVRFAYAFEPAIPKKVGRCHLALRLTVMACIAAYIIATAAAGTFIVGILTINVFAMQLMWASLFIVCVFVATWDRWLKPRYQMVRAKFGQIHRHACRTIKIA